MTPSITRRHAVNAIAAGAVLALTRGAGAQSAWPSRPLTLVVAGAAGGSLDVFARSIGDKLGQALGQPVIVDTRPGANGAIACRFVASARPDGYTLLFAGNSALVLNSLTVPGLPYDVERDLVSVAQVVTVPFAIAVPASSPLKTMKDLVALARTEDVFFGAAGVASISRLVGELLNQKAGTRLVHVPYPSSVPAQTDAVAGRLPVLIDAFGGLAAFAKADKLRILGLSGKTRLKAFADVPTISETIAGFEIPGVNSIVAPAGTPVDAMERLNRELQRIAKDPELAERFAQFGAEAASGSRAELDKTLKDQRAMFRALIAQAHIKIE